MNQIMNRMYKIATANDICNELGNNWEVITDALFTKFQFNIKVELNTPSDTMKQLFSSNVNKVINYFKHYDNVMNLVVECEITNNNKLPSDVSDECELSVFIKVRDENKIIGQKELEKTHFDTIFDAAKYVDSIKDNFVFMYDIDEFIHLILNDQCDTVNENLDSDNLKIVADECIVSVE